MQMSQQDSTNFLIHFSASIYTLILNASILLYDQNLREILINL